MFWDRVFLASALAISSVVCPRPEIVDEILPEVKPQHSVGFLNCTVVNMDSIQNSDTTYVQWSKIINVEGHPEIISEGEKITYQGNDENLEDTGEKKYSIVTKYVGQNRKMYTLIIRRLTETDTGTYLCTIVLEGLNWENWPIKRGELTVQFPPKIIPLDADKNTLSKKIGENVSIECTSSGNPSPNITWKREDGKSIQDRGFQIRNKTLYLLNVQLQDRGNYLCVADNNVKPPDSYKLQVKIDFRPICRPVQSSVGQAQNRRFNAKLECIVAGYPVPSMMWTKKTSQGNIKIVDDDKYDISKQSSSQLQSDETWYTLIVKNVQANDYTDYDCIGTNTYGSGSIKIQLFETMECQGANCPSIGTSGAAYTMSSMLTLILTAFVTKFLWFSK